MATGKGATMHQHNDYKVQQEFERVNKSNSKVSETISFQQGNGGRGGNSTNVTNNTNIVNEPTLWALTVQKNSITQVAPNDKKKVQVVNFQDNVYSGKTFDCYISWEMTKESPSPDFLTIPDGLRISIKAKGKISVVEMLNELKAVITQVISGTMSIVNDYTTEYPKLLLKLKNDEDNPGENKYYGTDGDGDKGWQDFPEIPEMPAGTVDGSVLRWNDSEGVWEESEEIKIYYDEVDEADWIKIQNSNFRKTSYLSDNEIDNNNSQQINFKFDDLSAYLGININDYFDTIEKHLIDAGIYSQLENGEADWQISGRLKARLYIAQTLTTENDLILCRVGGTGGVEVFKINELGKILSNYLSGTGNRLLYADESGNIEAGTGLEGELHTHTNKDVLDDIIKTGGGDEFLSDDGTYKAIDTGLEYFDETRTIATPNATIPAHQIIAKGTETHIDAVLSPKGNGAILANIPNNLATGGNKRGNKAVDLQMSRSSASDVASGVSSTIAGGERNTAGGDYAVVSGGSNNFIDAGKHYSVISGGRTNQVAGSYSCVAGGYSNKSRSNYCSLLGGSDNVIDNAYSSICGGANNTISSERSFIGGGFHNATTGHYSAILGGHYGRTLFHGQQAHASERCAATGDAQRSDYVLIGKTLTTNYYRLYLNGSNALIDLSQTGAYSTWQCKLKVTGLRKLTGSIDHFVSEHNFMIYRENSTPVIADFYEIRTHQVGGSSVATGVYITTNSLAIDIATTESDWQFVAHLETVETFAASLV